MGDSHIWKEAKTREDFSRSEDADDWEEDAVIGASDDDERPEDDREEHEEEEVQSSDSESRGRSSMRAERFLYKRLNLCLKRNITAVSNPNQHKPKQDYFPDRRTITFDDWLSNAIVAISPDADYILFAAQSPEKNTFFAKLDPKINQYNIETLEIPLDYDEQVTSLLCLPIMSNQKMLSSSNEWTTLAVGLSTGYIKFCLEQSICLLNLKFCDEPIIGIKCQTLKQNGNGRSETHFASLFDELLIIYKSTCVIIDCLTLYDNLRLARDEVVKNGFNYEPAYTLTDLPSILNCQKWKLDNLGSSNVCDADLLGTRRATLFDSLKSDSINIERVPLKACFRTLAIVGRDPFFSCCSEPKETKSHSYTEMIGSLFSIFNKKPEPTRAQISEIFDSSTISLFDKDRLATSIVPSPDRRLAAVTDDFGRVLLVENTNGIVIRMWKGYRSAQCGWIEVKKNPEKRDSPQASFLVIYAPKRGLLEVWSTQRGPRVAAYNVGKYCRLLYSGYKMLNMRADHKSTINPVEQSYSSHCYLLNAQSENVFTIELPYTYSLYKYGDLKSRDNLLINEVVNALQQDADVVFISDILNRIALVDSLQTSLHKICASFTPDKIAPIMENLIVKTMKNYDNNPGEPITDDDRSIIELCKRIIRLCGIFKVLSESSPHEISLPDVNQRLIDQYEEHPQEVDEFAEQLGWSAQEVLRYLSLLSLERSYRAKHLSNPWPSLGEPLAWSEFISCFDLNRVNYMRKSRREGGKVSENSKNTQDIQPIKLKKFTSEFLNEDKVMKTAIFMYNRLSETYYKSTLTSGSKESIIKLANTYNHLEPSSRLALLVQFWLSTKLCNHWKMWAYLQGQIGQISDELKVIAMSHDDDRVLVDTWKQIYQLILESDNIFAAIICTATIKSDTLRMLQDNERREKLEKEKNDQEEKSSIIDWECLCIDAERMSLLTQQLEDVFLLSLLLKYSPQDGHLVDRFVYRVARVSVANILRAGPTIVSELVAQWAVQSVVDLKVFIKPYGSQMECKDGEEDEVVIASSSKQAAAADSGSRFRLFNLQTTNHDHMEHTKELIHHTKTSYPCSLQPDVVIVNCIWDLCRRWNGSSSDKMQLLRRAYHCLKLLSSAELKHKLSCLAYKTFFHNTFERLSLMLETNGSLLNAKSSRQRDTFTRKELNMGEDCLEDFVQFCCDLSEFMLQTLNEANAAREGIGATLSGEEDELETRLLAHDRWWTTTTAAGEMLLGNDLDDNCSKEPVEFLLRGQSTNTLMKTILLSSKPLDVNFLVELNSLSSLMNIIFKLNITRAYPMSLVGEESRQTLNFNLQKVVAAGSATDLRNRPNCSLLELRHRFARKCVANLVAKLSEDTNEFNEEFETDVEGGAGGGGGEDEDIDTKQSLSAAASCRQHNRSDMDIGSGGSKTPHGGLFSLESSTTNFIKNENNEFMALFGSLLSLAAEWELDCDELYLELVFELYRCNHDKLAAQISTRVADQERMAQGLLKIASQRVLCLFGLSPQVSGPEWRQRSDKWSIFQPNVASWLKSIQQEEMKREIGPLKFCEALKSDRSNAADGADMTASETYGLQHFVLRALRQRTKPVLEMVTNYLDGQAGRLAYDLLQLLKAQHLFAPVAATKT